MGDTVTVVNCAVWIQAACMGKKKILYENICCESHKLN
jgi:hypothetical protein